MPVEIRELTIKIDVRAGAPAGSNEPVRSAENASAAADPDQILKSCVDEVMQLLRSRAER